MKTNPIAIHWFRRDLRLKDNHSLFKALSYGPTLGVFIFDDHILSKLPKKDARVEFILDALNEINSTLEKYGSCLLVGYGNPEEEWKKILEKYKPQRVYSNEDYEPYAIKRDSKIRNLCEKQGVEFLQFKDQVIFHKEDVLKDSGEPYVVFTPYKRKWLSHFQKNMLKAFPSESKLKNFTPFNQESMTLKKLGFERSEIQFPKKVFLKSIISDYDTNRDFPSTKGTSLLGVHLRFGTLSVRRAMEVAFQLNATWQSELVWREFFMQILYQFPHVVKKSFRADYDKIKWRNNKNEFKAWCEGRTGYPLVDAGMRELNTTGHMHNRVRMVAASFLCKHLLIDWRWGEKYFAEKLLDFDLSANNGNWQWAAGTGCDAAPYFRIFNPESQLKKFDKDSAYTSKWVPEWNTDEYQEPIVDHKMARERALKTYKVGLGK